MSELAGELKVAKKASLVDCFAAALAKREKAEKYPATLSLSGGARDQSRLAIEGLLPALKKQTTLRHDPDRSDRDVLRLVNKADEQSQLPSGQTLMVPTFQIASSSAASDSNLNASSSLMNSARAPMC